MWTVIEFNGVTRSGSYKWLCKCDCGNIRSVSRYTLTSGSSTNCGCQRKHMPHDYNKKHGGKNDRLYNVWNGIKQRCLSPSDRAFPEYGGRGISICPEWADDYLSFKNWALSNGYDSSAKKYKCTIDRIDNNKGYSPDNCRWVSQKTQCNNRRSNRFISYNGEKHTISEWADIIGIRKDTLRRRIDVYHWPAERALTEPNRRRHNC